MIGAETIGADGWGLHGRDPAGPGPAGTLPVRTGADGVRVERGRSDEAELAAVTAVLLGAGRAAVVPVPGGLAPWARDLRYWVPGAWTSGTPQVVVPRPVLATAAGRRTGRRRTVRPAARDGALASPMQGTVVRLAVHEGQRVAEGDLVAVLEAMKMEQPLTAHRAGTVTGLSADVGTAVRAGTVLCTIAA